MICRTHTYFSEYWAGPRAVLEYFSCRVTREYPEKLRFESFRVSFRHSRKYLMGENVTDVYSMDLVVCERKVNGKVTRRGSWSPWVLSEASGCSSYGSVTAKKNKRDDSVLPEGLIITYQVSLRFSSSSTSQAPSSSFGINYNSLVLQLKKLRSPVWKVWNPGAGLPGAKID